VLCCACRANHVVLIEGLLDKGVSLTATDINGFMPLHIMKSTEAVKLLVKKGAGLEVKSLHGYTPLHLACAHEATETAELLNDNCANTKTTNIDGESLLHSACKFAKVKTGALLLDKGADANMATGARRLAGFSLVSTCFFVLHDEPRGSPPRSGLKKPLFSPQSSRLRD